MPIYEFKCTKCDFVFDELLSIKVKVDSTECPRCSWVALKSSGSYLTVSPGLPNGFNASRGK